MLPKKLKVKERNRKRKKEKIKINKEKELFFFSLIVKKNQIAITPRQRRQKLDGIKP
jgi:hypothetical protein